MVYHTLHHKRYLLLLVVIYLLITNLMVVWEAYAMTLYIYMMRSITLHETYLIYDCDNYDEWMIIYSWLVDHVLVIDSVVIWYSFFKSLIILVSTLIYSSQPHKLFTIKMERRSSLLFWCQVGEFRETLLLSRWSYIYCVLDESL